MIYSSKQQRHFKISLKVPTTLFCKVNRRFRQYSFTGCGNEFAKQEYNDDEKIVQITDRYAKSNSVFNPIEGGYSLTASQFDGRETLWEKT